jgi:AraC-like DNA-binding protein
MALAPATAGVSISPTPAGDSRAEGAAFAEGEVLFLNLPLRGAAFASQDGRSAYLAEGDFAFVDSTRPFELRFEQPLEQVSLVLPHELLWPLLAAPHEFTAVRVRGDRGVGAVASGALRALASADATLDMRTRQSLTDQLAGLVALALRAARADSPSATRTLILQAALEEVERSLGDPELSPASVAEQVGISTRYLHQLFSGRGPSFGRWVLIRRLQRSREDLLDPSRAHWTISGIAHHRGFRDASYFARAFKELYGASPRELRRGATGGKRRP